MCEAFGLGPVAAWRELEQDPGLVMEVLEARAYKRAYHRVISAKAEGDIPAEGVDPMIDAVFRNVMGGL